MNKRIVSFFLCFIMIVSMMSAVMPTMAAGSTTYKITADKTEAHPGDTITYTVAMGPVENIAGTKFKLSIPVGLTYVEGSGKAVDGLQETLNAAKAEFTESTKVFAVLSSNYTSTEDTVLMNFQCTVDAGVTGEKTVDFIIDDPDNIFDTDYDNISFTTTPATVNVKVKPVPVTGVTLNKTSVSINAGSTEQLTATIAPNNATNTAVTWKSDNTAVVTVSNTGLVTAVKMGTANITVTTADGNKTAVCAVTVNCAHADKTVTEEKASDCKTQGWEKYFTCNGCGQLFAADGTTKIDAVPYRALGAHNYGTLVGKVSATHNAAGMKAYYLCSVCGKYFAEDFTETTKDALVIPKQNHDTVTAWTKDETKHYKECSCGAHLEEANHSFTWVTDTPATEDNTGLKHEECICGLKQKEGTVIPKLDHTHKMDKTDAKASDCVTHGNNEYYYCTKCEKYFKDEAGTTETTPEEEKLPLGAHAYEWVIDTPATEDETGLKHEECKVCHEKQKEGTVIEKLDHVHKMDKVDAKASDCVTQGNNEYYHCAKCEKYFKDATGTTETTPEAEKLALAAHQFVWKTDKKATTTQAGLKHEECKVCGFKRSENTVIPMLKPTATPTPEVTTKPNTNEVPKTADNSNAPLWSVLLMLSCGAMAVMGVASKKREVK